MSESTSDFEFNISQDFIESGKVHIHKRGGPYSKNDKIKRQNEVHRLHYEYGYSARKISEIMNVNRNTINGDIDYWNNKISSSFDHSIPEQAAIFHFQRFNIQRSRLRESLDKAENFQQKIAIEKMIFDIDCKIMNSEIKMIDSYKRVHDLAVYRVNEIMREHKIDQQVLTLFDMVFVSDKSKNKISKIIKEDRNKINRESA